MADVQMLMTQMTKASQAAHEELDAWMVDAGGTPDTVHAKVQEFRALRADWLLVAYEVAMPPVVDEVPPPPPVEGEIISPPDEPEPEPDPEQP